MNTQEKIEIKQLTVLVKEMFFSRNSWPLMAHADKTYPTRVAKWLLCELRKLGYRKLTNNTVKEKG